MKKWFKKDMLTKQELKEKLLDLKIFDDNSYLDNYVELIINNQNTQIQKGSTNRHHIIPRSYFRYAGLPINNNDDNMVNLIFTDHIMAHYYLSLCIAEAKNRYANQAATLYMCRTKKIDISNLQYYQTIYEEYQKNNSELHKGRTHTLSDECKKAIGIKNKINLKGKKWVSKDGEMLCINPDQLDNYLNSGWENTRKSNTYQPTAWNKGITGYKTPAASEARKNKISKALSGKPKSNQSKANMSKAHSGKILVSNDSTRDSLYIFKEQFNEYIEIGYHRGRLSKK